MSRVLHGNWNQRRFVASTINHARENWVVLGLVFRMHKGFYEVQQVVKERGLIYELTISSVPGIRRNKNFKYVEIYHKTREGLNDSLWMISPLKFIHAEWRSCYHGLCALSLPTSLTPHPTMVGSLLEFRPKTMSKTIPRLEY